MAGSEGRGRNSVKMVTDGEDQRQEWYVGEHGDRTLEEIEVCEGRP